MRAIDADKLFAAFEDADWFDNADRDIAEDMLLDAPVVNQTEQPDPDTGLMNCDYCNGGDEQKPLFHENNYEPHTCMQSYIEISESSYGKKPLICVDLWDGANACAAFEINFCPMCGRKLEGRQ